jgi:hypothetical protein
MNNLNYIVSVIFKERDMKLILVAALLTSFGAFAQDKPQLINWFAGADIVGTTGNTDTNIDSDFYVREFEFSAFSAIDQTWNGVLTLAYHKESTDGEEHVEVHEAFLNSSKLFNLSNVKVGKFFLGFGRLNRFHRHDWVFTDAPYVQKSFFGTEGAKDTGVEYTKNLVNLGLSTTLGLTKGDDFNHAEHDHDSTTVERAKAPTAYLRAAKFIEFSTLKGMEIGLNLVNRVDAESKHYQYAGLDLTYKNRVGKVLDTLVQAEFWNRTTKHEEDDETEEMTDYGAYVYFEKGIDQHHAYGVRLDYYKADDHEEEAGSDHDHSVDGIEVENELKALSLSYTYKNSEFMKTRLTVEHGQGVHVEDDEDVDSYTKGFVQFVFNIGAHPAHVF